MRYNTELIEGYFVTASDGSRLWVKIIQPDENLYQGNSFPVVISIPGGLGSGENNDLHLAEMGFVEVHFNPQGRGVIHPSEGNEDYNGHIHQDGLKAVIDFVHSRSNIDNSSLGLIAFSYGISIAAGCLARHPHLNVSYLIDIEGPSDSFVISFEPWVLGGESFSDYIETGKEIFDHYSIYRDPSPENRLWWSEREALGFIGKVGCPYLRIQAEEDHAQPPNEELPDLINTPLWYRGKHAVDLINAATKGHSPWTRVNGSSVRNPINKQYNMDEPPLFYPGAWEEHEDELIDIVKEMAMNVKTAVSYQRSAFS